MEVFQLLLMEKKYFLESQVCKGAIERELFLREPDDSYNVEVRFECKCCIALKLYNIYLTGAVQLNPTVC
jgi:hypothetical protein